MSKPNPIVEQAKRALDLGPSKWEHRNSWAEAWGRKHVW